MTKGATGYFDAFILVLTHVNYSTVECRIHQYTFQCRRGESVMSMVHWAELFGWKRSRTRYFFNKMYDEGIIERLSNPYITHIRIPSEADDTKNPPPADKQAHGRNPNSGLRPYPTFSPLHTSHSS